MFYRQAWLDINLDYLADNINYLTSLHPDKKLMAVIKANGYGAGDYHVATVAISQHVDYLAVSSLDEALCLRYRGIQTPILSLGYILPEHLLTAQKHNVTISVDSLEHAYSIKKSKVTGLILHIKIDTGMNRLGFKKVSEVQQAIDLLKEENHIEGIYTHYVDSGIADNPFTDQQYQLFENILKETDYTFEYIHADNSDAILSRKDPLTNMMRAGIAMLGISSYESELKPVVSLYTRTTLCKKVKKDETVSYSATYRTTEDEWIATLPIGYADGFIRHNQGRNVYIEEEYAPLVGRICMDQCMIHVSKEYPVNTLVEIFGSHISLVDMAKELDTIPYEILTGMSERLARVYRQNNEILAIENHRLDSLLNK